MTHHRSRRPARHRRPAPPSPTRAQVRQRINRLSVLYKLEALLELQKPEPDYRSSRTNSTKMPDC